MLFILMFGVCAFYFYCFMFIVDVGDCGVLVLCLMFLSLSVSVGDVPECECECEWRPVIRHYLRSWHAAHLGFGVYCDLLNTQTTDKSDSASRSSSIFSFVFVFLWNLFYIVQSHPFAWSSHYFYTSFDTYHISFISCLTSLSSFKSYCLPKMRLA